MWKKINKIGTWLTIVISLILGVFLLYWAYNQKDNFIKHITESFGLAIITGGIFSGILQLFGFFKFFRDELMNILYDYKSLEKRNDLKTLWEKVTETLYNKKFPEISNRLNDIIIDEYFPTNLTHYYKDYKIYCNFKILDKSKGLIQLEEHFSFKIIPASAKEEININFIKKIPMLDSNDTDTSFELKSFMINGKNKATEPIIEKNNNTLIVRNNYKVKEKKQYNVEYTSIKKYYIEVNHDKGFRTNYICDGVKLQIVYPPELKLSFFSSGTVNKFKTENKIYKNILIEEYNDILLPHQGFNVTLQLN